MKKHLTISTTVTLTALILLALLSQRSVDARQDDRAQTLLSQARAALGGDAKLKSIQTLSTTAKFRKIIARDQPEISGEVQLDFSLPDKYIASEVSNLPMGDAQITRINGFNGDQPFRDVRTSGGGGNVFVKTGNGPEGQQSQAAQLRAVRAEFSRYLIGWLLTAPATQIFAFSYGGEAQAEEGRADVIDVKSADDFAMKLLLDQETHRPLMIIYSGVAPRMVMSMRTMPPGHRDAEKMTKESQGKAAKDLEGQPEAKTVEIQMYLSDYRSEGGILLPHHMIRAINGEVTEEWDMTKFKINPPLKAESFKK